MITITDARITADLREATVFYTVLGDAAEQAGTAAALESAKGLLRSTVGKALGLRHSPTLAFVHDNVQEQVKHIDDLLAAARNADAEVQRLGAAGAQYAGDAAAVPARATSPTRTRRAGTRADGRPTHGDRRWPGGHAVTGSGVTAPAQPADGRRRRRTGPRRWPRSVGCAARRPGAAGLSRQPRR